MIRSVLILGGGSAGLIAALSLRTHLPQLAVRVVRSREIGIIGVGEGSTNDLPNHLHGFLGIDPRRFHAEAKPTFKLGVRFLWGPGGGYNYTFSNQVTGRLPGLPKSAGFYSQGGLQDADLASALMSAGRVFGRQPNGAPDVQRIAGYHLENADFVACLDRYAHGRGVQFTEATVTRVEPGPAGVAALHLSTGERVEADLFVDASGFRSELLGQTLAEPFIDYSDTLFCDRAVLGGWERTTEPLLPYTTAQTMTAGWAWQIEHERHINRGYVYSSGFISDEQAEAEFREKNPKLKQTRVVQFRIGRTRRNWVGNVFGIGNSSGFVEPLEATALLVICHQARFLTWMLTDSDCDPPTTLKESANRLIAGLWDEIRDFLAIHYRFNTRVDSPFWRHCQQHTALHGAERIVDFYRENGPSDVSALELLNPAVSIFRLEGFYTHLLGQQVAHQKPLRPSPADLARWNEHRLACERSAANGLTMTQTLAFLRDPRWSWTKGFYAV